MNAFSPFLKDLENRILEDQEFEDKDGQETGDHSGLGPELELIGCALASEKHGMVPPYWKSTQVPQDSCHLKKVLCDHLLKKYNPYRPSLSFLALLFFIVCQYQLQRREGSEMLTSFHSMDVYIHSMHVIVCVCTDL